MGLGTDFADWLADRVLWGKRTRRTVMDRLLRQGVLFLEEAPDHAVVFFPNDVVGRQIEDTREFARQSVCDLRAQLENHGRFEPGMTILEVGANIGTQAIYFFRDFEASRVFALEPDPDNNSVLRHNIALNGLNARVDSFELAGSDHKAQLV